MLHLQVREEHRQGTGMEWRLCRLDLTTYLPLSRWVVPTVPVSQPSYPWGLSFCLIFVIREFKKGLLVATASQPEGRNLAVYSWLMPPLRPTAVSHLSLRSLAHPWMTKVFFAWCRQPFKKTRVPAKFLVRKFPVSSYYWLSFRVALYS